MGSRGKVVPTHIADSQTEVGARTKLNQGITLGGSEHADQHYSWGGSEGGKETMTNPRGEGPRNSSLEDVTYGRRERSVMLHKSRKGDWDLEKHAYLQHRRQEQVSMSSWGLVVVGGGSGIRPGGKGMEIAQRDCRLGQKSA